MTTHKFISFLTFLLLTFAIAFGQGKEDTNYRLFKIKKIYQQINQYKNYETITIDEAEEFLGHGTDNGGCLTGYFKGDSVKKVVEWVGLSNRAIQNEYYFDGDKLIFVYSTESKYRFNDSTQSLDYSKLDNIFKERYYFNNDKLLDTIFDDKEHSATKKQDSEDFITSSKGYLKLLKTKRK